MVDLFDNMTDILQFSKVCTYRLTSYDKRQYFIFLMRFHFYFNAKCVYKLLLFFIVVLDVTLINFIAQLLNSNLQNVNI